MEYSKKKDRYFFGRNGKKNFFGGDPKQNKKNYIVSSSEA
jgi:hypothetical protein